MSYDIYLKPTEERCERCGREHDYVGCPNPTYNLTPIFHLALTGEPQPNPDVSEGSVVLLGAKTDRPRGLRILDGRSARDTVADLTRAAERLADPEWEARFRALEPANGWGNLSDARRVVERLRDLAAANPSCTWEVH